MARAPVRSASLTMIAAAALCCSSCGGGKKFYPVHGRVVANGQPAHGVLVALHLIDDTDLRAARPSATTRADGTFEIKTFLADEHVVKDGAPAGKYVVTCVWWSLDRAPYVGSELPDKLKRHYSEPATSPLRADIPEAPTDLPTIELKY